LYQGLRLSRLWLALILVAFCLPLFVGLGRPDLETDEAIYSFAVDRILEAGDWLEPKSSPSETDVFLEKPPLKFWIVAAPIKAGLLPHNEFGLRFWDAVAGGAALVYVLAIGSLLAGPVCGAVAALLLFIHWPFVFAHGLRTNNMEASLVLSYCAGVFHFLRWAAVDDPKRRRWHAVWAGLFFVLGFMTKFVAALFLPFTLGVAALASRRCRARLVEDWRTWLAVTALVVGLCAPWFVYAHLRFGSQLWETMLGEHVLKRMTNYLDPTHVHPWYYYLEAMWKEFGLEQVQPLMVAGVIVLLVQTIRRRWFDGAVVLLWATIPMAIISSGTSKLYHYAFPYLPPIALAAGYLVALVVMLAPVVLRKLLEWVEDTVIARWPALQRAGQGARARRVAAALIVVAAAIAIVSVAIGGLRIEVNRTVLFKSSGVLRPALLIVLAALATRTSARVSRLLVALFVFGAMPLDAYRGQLGRLDEGAHPIRTAVECMHRVDAERGSAAGVFIDIPEGIWHPLYYYFRRARPVTITQTPLDPAMEQYLLNPAFPRPVLISEPTWRVWADQHREALGQVSPPMLSFLNTVLILPGPYSACSSESALHTVR
jgi:4-amino-4-deoxy-L-arabinose transferase-like glycosyltransferase